MAKYGSVLNTIELIRDISTGDAKGDATLYICMLEHSPFIVSLAVAQFVLRLCSHGNYIPLSYQSNFWNRKVDCSYGSSPLSYQFWVLFKQKNIWCACPR